MTLAIYPGPDLLPGLTYSQKWAPAFFNERATTATGADIDLGLAQYPLHDFILTYEFLRDGLKWTRPATPQALPALEFKTLMGFHLQIAGTLGRFLYKNPDDHSVSQNNVGTGDGTTKTFTLTRTFGANGYFASEPIGQVNTDPSLPFNVYLGGSSTPVDPSLYTLDTSSPLANTITFGTAPTLGQAVTVDMDYLYYCKLADNSNTFEKFMDRLWSVSKVTLHSCRPGA